jgi:uncharacterized protein
MLRSAPQNRKPLPARAGIGLRAPHYRELLGRRPDIGWLEVHSENYFGDGGQPLYFLEQARAYYPLSLHGVGLSLGSTDTFRQEHLVKLKRLADRFEPALVSDHLCWCSSRGCFLNDLLPLPYTEEALAVACRHVDQVQEFLGRQILVENVSSYLQFSHSTLNEWDFIREVSARTGCGILLDVNNIHVSAVNHSFDSRAYLNGIPREVVREIHLAGYDQGPGCLIDTHGNRVADAVWSLYQEALARYGAVPTLIEWDTDIPALDVLLAEAEKAEALLGKTPAVAYPATTRAAAVRAESILVL